MFFQRKFLNRQLPDLEGVEIKLSARRSDERKWSWPDTAFLEIGVTDSELGIEMDLTVISVTRSLCRGEDRGTAICPRT